MTVMAYLDQTVTFAEQRHYRSFFERALGERFDAGEGARARAGLAPLRKDGRAALVVLGKILKVVSAGWRRGQTESDRVSD
jgi:hypothetical protein